MQLFSSLLLAAPVGMTQPAKVLGFLNITGLARRCSAQSDIEGNQA